MEVFKQLESVEWQLCKVQEDTGKFEDAEKTKPIKIDRFYMCPTDGPTNILARWLPNEV